VGEHQARALAQLLDMQPGPVVADLVKALVGKDVPVCAVVPVKANLESLFMTVTKGELQ